MFMTSYLCKYPESNPYISDDDHLKNEDNFCAKNYKSKILTKS